MKIKLKDFELYYDRIGQGSPLIMLHGNGEDSRTLSRLARKLSKNFTIYLLDSRGHGKSICDVEEFDYITMAMDIREFIELKKLEKVNIYGFSDGGIIAIYCALLFPQYLKSIMVSGVNINPSGLKFLYRLNIKSKLRFSKTEKDRKLYTLMLTKPLIRLEELKKIQMPVFVSVASNDVVKKSHTNKIIKAFTTVDYVMVKKANHFDYVLYNDTLYKPLIDFIRKHNLI